MIEIGLEVDGLRAAPKEALRTAARLGFRPVQISAARGAVAPEALSESGRRHLRRYVADLGLSLAALGADLGGLRFDDAAGLDERLDRTKRILEMARQLGVPVVTARIGSLRGSDGPRGGLLGEALAQIAEHADKTGTQFAIETAGTSGQQLATLLSDLNCPFVRAAYDPAALLMEGEDPVASVEPLADAVAHAFARDGVAGIAEHPGHETALGEGHIDFAACLAALAEAGFGGPQIIRRTATTQPVEELAAAKARLEQILAG